MKTFSAPFQVTFDRLTNLFTTKSESVSVLEPHIGEGLVQNFNLAKGLQVRFWDCSFKQGIEMYTNAQTSFANTNFTLAFFPVTKGFRFGNRDSLLKESVIWDTVLFSSNANYKMYISPDINSQCISLSFSKNWLSENVFKGDDAFKNLEEKMLMGESFSLLDSMNALEKKFIEDLLNISWKKFIGSFYIKSCVLKIIFDFFHKIKQRETFSISKPCLDTSINQVEKTLRNNLAGKLPNIRELALKFSVSELTLKRHFKRRYGVNISTYFMRRKMEYAKLLLHEKNLNIAEAANLLGYRNVNRFIATFKKYQES